MNLITVTVPAALTLAEASASAAATPAAPAAARDPMSFAVLLSIVAVLGLLTLAWAWWVRPVNMALGLGTALAMWTLSYVALLQPGFLVSELLFAAVVGCVVLGGYVAGRMSRTDAALGASGLSTGCISAVFNALLLGAVIGRKLQGDMLGPVLYAVGLFAASALLGWVGHAWGARRAAGVHHAGQARELPAPAAMMCAVFTAGILVMIVLGGLVTSHEAGLAVPDWPHTFGHNMLLYPLSEMSGGVFYEHAHRLFGTLIGVSALVTCAVVFRTERRGLVRGLALAALVLVIVQGILGGLRVTGNMTTSIDPSQLAPSARDGVIHAVLGQVVLALAALLMLVATRRWAQASPVSLVAARGLQIICTATVGAMLVQLFLGVCIRHLQTPPTADAGAKIPAWALHSHITMALLVAILGLIAGMRAGHVHELPLFRRTGKAVMHTIGLQLGLGVGALVVVLIRRGETVPWWEAGMATAHQAVGALLLMLTVLLAAQTFRFMTPAEEPTTEKRPAAPPS